MNSKVDLFLDSGAWSAFTQNDPLDIDGYIDYIKKNKECYTAYAALDVVRGDPEDSMNNFLYMREKGLNPLPVYHCYEDLNYLKEYLSMKNVDYICIGGMVSITSEQRRHVFDIIWNDYLTDDKGYPKLKVHGFGITSTKMIIRYPWWSVDSSSWVQSSLYGGVFVPKMKNGKYIFYPDDPNVFTVSSRTKEFNQMDDHTKKYISDYVNSLGYKMGKSEFYDAEKGYELSEDEIWIGAGKKKFERYIEYGIINDVFQRDQINIYYFCMLEKCIPKWPWKFKFKRKNLLFDVGER